MPDRLVLPDRRTFLRSAGAGLAVLLSGCSTSRPGARPRIRFVGEWGEKGEGPGEFASPIGLAINTSDELFVTDVQNARVQKFDASGGFLSEFPLAEEGMAFGGGIDVDRQGRIYVSLMFQHVVRVFDAEGRPLRSWGSQGDAPGQFREPGGLAVGADGTVYVADQTNRRVQAFTSEGRFLRSWGQYGQAPGQFDGIEPADSRFGGPHYVAIDDHGRLFTTEGAHGRVQQWTRDGYHLAVWGDKREGPGGFGGLDTEMSEHTFGPIGICTDHKGRVWVSSLNGRVQLFTSDGEYLVGIGSQGSGPGQFITPHAMVVSSRGDLYVVDSGNHRVQRFAVDEVFA